jgi:hypothetical protein
MIALRDPRYQCLPSRRPGTETTMKSLSSGSEISAGSRRCGR